MPIELSERQQATVATAVTIVAAAVIVVAVGAIFWLVGAFFAMFSNIFLPLAVAAVAALVVKPYYDLIRRRLHVGRVPALIAVFLTVIVPLVVFSWFFGALIVEQIRGFVASCPVWWQNSVDWMAKHLPQVTNLFGEHPLGESISGAVDGQTGMIVNGIQLLARRALTAGAGVMSWIGVLVCWAVFPIYFAFFLMTETSHIRDLERHLPFLKADTRQNLVYLLEEFVNIVVAFFRGQLIIAFLQGLLFGIGFTVVGLSYGFVIGLILGFLNIIPYLGNIIGLATALPLAFFQTDGGLGRVVAVLVVFAVVQMVEGYFLTPKIMGDRTGLHPVVIIVAIFFWSTALNGIMGMILAIPLTAFLVVFWRLAREKYLPELV